jgi:hypothetical protein
MVVLIVSWSQCTAYIYSAQFYLFFYFIFIGIGGKKLYKPNSSCLQKMSSGSPWWCSLSPDDIKTIYRVSRSILFIYFSFLSASDAKNLIGQIHHICQKVIMPGSPWSPDGIEIHLAFISRPMLLLSLAASR